MIALGSHLCYSGGIARCTMMHAILLDKERAGLCSIVTSEWSPNKIVSPWCHLTGISECLFTSSVTARWRGVLVVKALASEGSEARSDRVWSTNALGRRLLDEDVTEGQKNAAEPKKGNSPRILRSTRRESDERCQTERREPQGLFRGVPLWNGVQQPVG